MKNGRIKTACSLNENATPNIKKKCHNVHPLIKLKTAR